jgi:hypothetical protein
MKVWFVPLSAENKTILFVAESCPRLTHPLQVHVVWFVAVAGVLLK